MPTIVGERLFAVGQLDDPRGCRPLICAAASGGAVPHDGQVGVAHQGVALPPPSEPVEGLDPAFQLRRLSAIQEATALAADPQATASVAGVPHRSAPGTPFNTPLPSR